MFYNYRRMRSVLTMYFKVCNLWDVDEEPQGDKPMRFERRKKR